MASKRDSLRESTSTGGRDFSLLAAAGMLVVFGLALSNHIIPNFHEQQTLEKRRNALRTEVKETRAELEQIKDEVQALDDPYYMAWFMVERYKWRYPPIDPTPTVAND